MFNFKNFFSKNHNTDFILEANKGDTPESAILIDNEDLDFLYQLDYKYWADAMIARYDVLLDELKIRDEKRRTVEMVFLKEFKKAYHSREDRQTISLDSFVDFVKRFATQYNDYGDRNSTPIEEKSRFKNWENDFRREYGRSFDRVKMKNSKDFISDIRYMIFNYIVPFVKEQPKYIIRSRRSSVWAKFYINRLIQKLETTRGEDITLPDNSHVLKNLSKVLMSEIPLEMPNTGSYGFDLNSARTKNFSLGSNQPYVLGKTRGFTFPSESGISELIRNLIKLNYQRHMGPLPSDENFKKYSQVGEDGSPSLVYKTAGVGRSLEDNFNYDTIENNISNKIRNFIVRNLKLDSWTKVLDAGLYDIIDSKFRNEIESGEWALDPKLAREVIRAKPGESKSKGGAVDPRMAADYVSVWRNISGNAMLQKLFSKEFSKKQVDHMLQAGQLVSGPRILDGDTPEERRINFDRIDSELKKEIEKNLSNEEIEEFINTGRLPLNASNIQGKIKLVPGKFRIHPVIMPFIKMKVLTKDEEGNDKSDEISVPLIKPGKYLSGFGSSNSKDDEKEEEDSQDSQDSQDLQISGKIPSSPSTSDRTSIYKLKDENGEEKEVKVIDAQSTERYIKKTGTGGAYYTIDTKGQSKKYSFSRWKESDKKKFMKVWSHPGMAGQNFDTNTIISIYKKLFGSDEDSNVVDEIYGGVDAYDFYKDEKLPPGLPYVLRAYRLGREDETPRASGDADPSQPSTTSTSNLGITILNTSSSTPEIIGFDPVIKAIKNCLKPGGAKVCHNDANEGFRDYLLEDPGRIQELHDYMVKETMVGGNKGVWKEFLGEGGRRASAILRFCSIMGKWMQSEGSRLSKRAPQHGQAPRKDRKELIGHLSRQAFDADYKNYVSSLSDLGKGSNSNTSSSSLKKIFDDIRKVKVLTEDDSDEITNWFYPGYKDLDSKLQGSFMADKNNFKITSEIWAGGEPPTDLRKVIKNLDEIKGRISQDDKDILLDKLKKEKEFLVGEGEGSVENGFIGLNSYIFNPKIFEKVPDFEENTNELTIRQLISNIHKSTSYIYNKDIEALEQIQPYKKEDEVERQTIDSISDEQDEYIKQFKKQFLSIDPTLNSLLINLFKLNNLESSLEVSRTIKNIDAFIGGSENSTSKFINNISILYYLFGNNNYSLIKSLGILIYKIRKEIKEGEKTSWAAGTTEVEKEFVKKNPGSSTKDFYAIIENIITDTLKVNFYLNQLFDNLILSLSRNEEYKKSLGLFLRKIVENKELGMEVLSFFRSNLYKSGVLKAPAGANVSPYKDNTQYIEKLQADFMDVTRKYKPLLPRVSASTLLNNPDDPNISIGKISRLEVLQVLDRQPDIAKKSAIAKRVKDFYVKQEMWDSQDSYFKKRIESAIVS